MVGYFLMGIVLLLATTILVYGAYGYGINTKTGQIIENGLLFIDSKPSGASIYLNGQLQSSKTSARLVVPAGDYKLTIQKDGYRSWQRSFVIDEHDIARYSYPFLFPVKPQTTALKDYSSLPTLITQTPDQHWLLIQQPASTATSLNFDEYDTTNLAAGAQTINFPVSLLNNTDSSPPVLKAVEWSTDNKHVLLEHTFPTGHEFIVFDRTDPSKSFNVNQMFKISPTSVSLRNKSINQLYVFDQAAGSLAVADTTQGVLDPVFLNHVLAYKAYGDSLLTYVTNVGVSKGEVQARIWNNGKTYPLYTFSAGTNYLIDAAQFQGHWYYVAGSDTSRIDVYEDPLNDIQNPAYNRAVPILGFNLPGATLVSFSDNTRFIGIEAGQSFGVYDLEAEKAYHYTVKQPLTAPVTWMDGHRWIGQSGSDVFAEDYDNTNVQLVTPTVYSGGGLFTSDYNQMITFAASPDSSEVILQRVDMRAGSDLPKDGAQ
ncbi:MAG TPA: PEGA domain-containing protein [Candidatus Binatia bacterium]|nr:PEGA domain-containing protein [Candidatus Binatia bacterium]